MQKLDRNIGFWEKRHFFRRKLSKIAENCDHNIGPRSHCSGELTASRKTGGQQGCQIFLGTTYQIGKIFQITILYGHIRNGGKIDKMSIQYTNIFHRKALQKLPQNGIFVLKICHLATLEDRRRETRKLCKTLVGTTWSQKCENICIRNFNASVLCT
jgi:hypothetical protein